MKQCNKCGEVKLVEMFAKDKTTNDKLQRRCKQCKKSIDKNHLQKFILSHHIVYLLPDHNYVGITNRPYIRMTVHRSEYNRNTDNWIELARFNSRKDALKCEAEYHAKGYKGAKKDTISGKTKIIY